jgi:hypothetical protein
MEVNQPPNVSIAARLVVSVSVFFLFALASVVTRLYTRFQTCRLGVDDYFIAVAMVGMSDRYPLAYMYQYLVVNHSASSRLAALLYT